MSSLETLQNNALSAVAALADLKAWDETRVKLIGKSGEITLQMQKIGSLPPEERKDFGAQVNKVKQAVQAALDAKREELNLAAINARLETEKVDVTLPVKPLQPLGKLHPITATMLEMEEILQRLGFAPATGPEVETDEYNFTKLNIPPEHPARQDHDTFYLKQTDAKGDRLVLRTQTSNVQLHAMEKYGAPLRIQHIGRVFRADSDQTHTPQFHQMECLAIDTSLTFGDLKGVITRFLNDFFGREMKMRFRPHYFPFTEPSMEVDVWWESEKGGRWLELMGSGMVHRNVLQNCGIDHEQYQGFALGCGIDRLAMLKYGINDLRLMFESHQAFLQHFGKLPAKVGMLS